MEDYAITTLAWMCPGKEHSSENFMPWKIIINFTDSLCTAAPSPKKKLGRSVCDLPFIILFKDHMIFPGMFGKLFDWLLPLPHDIIEATSFDWLSFSWGFEGAALHRLLRLVISLFLKINFSLPLSS